jgi:acyl carrier protein
MEVFVLDELGRPVVPGQVGEIAVRSHYISLGYWGRTDLTEAAFRSSGVNDEERTYLTGDLGVMLPDGCLEHRGRKDHQVKIQGNRVDLSEVEKAMLDLHSVKEAVVQVRRNSRNEDYLVVFWTGNQGCTVTETVFRETLAKTLPVYAIPSAFVGLGQLPLTPNGKIDRRALMELDVVKPATDEFVPPRTPIETEIAAMWAELLKVERIGVHDCFFALGGQSLSATQAILKINSEFNVELTPNTLFENSSVEMVALLVLEQLLSRA